MERLLDPPKTVNGDGTVRLIVEAMLRRSEVPESVEELMLTEPVPLTVCPETSEASSERVLSAARLVSVSTSAKYSSATPTWRVDMLAALIATVAPEQVRCKSALMFGCVTAEVSVREPLTPSNAV